MESLIGIVGADFVLLAADRVAARSIVVMKGEEDKFRSLSPHVFMAYSGEPGDTVNFAEYIKRNVQLYMIKNDLELGTEAAAHYTRRELADSLRSRNPYNVNVLIGGASKQEGPQLFWIDYLSALTKVPFAAHGYSAHFLLSLMDRHYRPGMDQVEVLELFKMCLRELKTRFIVNLPEFAVRIVRAEGTEEMVVSV